MNVGHENDEGVIHYLNRSQITFLVDKLKNFFDKDGCQKRFGLFSLELFFSSFIYLTPFCEGSSL